MRRRTAALALVAAGLAVVPSLSSPASAAPSRGDARVCAATTGAVASCDAHVRTLIDSHGKARPDATSTPSFGYTPQQLKTAYGITTGATTPVAVVDAYASPYAASDLAAYRNAFGLSSATFTLTQVNQTGGSKLPRGNTGWGQEEMLDLEMVSAICPSCPITYVGANSASFTDLGTAVNTAAKLGAKVISNSYGASEFSGELNYAKYYNHPGVAITVSSGDSGYGVQVPAAYNTVTAVGGTSLTVNGDGTRADETVWNGAGSGCSAYVPRPSWQTDPNCGMRTVADVSAVADPKTGVAVYDSYGSSRGQNWYVFGGTSVASPIIGAVYAVSGNTGSATGPVTIPAQLAYSSGASLFDVKTGSNGTCGSYLCTGGTGYDGPTGNGTPIGASAF